MSAAPNAFRVAGPSLLLAALLLSWAACDDAVLGVRAAACEAGDCIDDAGRGADDAGAARPDGSACPVVAQPVCDAGTAVAERDGVCVTGYRCQVVCASLPEGRCSVRAACAGGRWSTSSLSDCDPSAGLGCCRACVPISPPPPDFCDGGTVTTVFEGDCAVAFACP